MFSKEEKWLILNMLQIRRLDLLERIERLDEHMDLQVLSKHQETLSLLKSIENKIS